MAKKEKKKTSFRKKHTKQGVVAHYCNPQKAEAGGLLQIWDHPRHKVSTNKQNQKRNKKGEEVYTESQQ